MPQRHRTMSNQLTRAKFVSTWTSKFSSWLPRRFKTANEIWRNRADHLTMATAYGLPNIVGPIFPGISADTAIQRRRSHISCFGWAYRDENHLSEIVSP